MEYKRVARANADWADKVIKSGANTVFTDNKKTAHLGSIILNGNAVVQGDLTVFVENKPISRIGDQTAKGIPIRTGYPKVFADENNSVNIILVEGDDVAAQPTSSPKVVENYLKPYVDAGIIKKKYATVSEATKTLATISTKSSKPSAPIQAAAGPIQACGQIHSLTSFPMDLRISSTFTLGNMLRRWVNGQLLQFPNHSLQANNGFSIDEIVCNLSLLANNIFEPLYKKFPNFIPTNTFREGASAITSRGTSSQHGAGQAADLIFFPRNVIGAYEAAVWIRDNLPFDQLLLEYAYTQYGLACWIHVSFTGNNIPRVVKSNTVKGNRGDGPVKWATFLNDSVYKDREFVIVGKK